MEYPSSSRLSRIASATVEAGWLIGAALVSLFINPTTLVYDLPRLSLFRALVLVMLAAHFIASAPPLSPPLAGGMKRGRWPLYVLAATVILSALTSISPLVSLWGSFFRQQGAYLLLAQIAWALLIAAYLRTLAQHKRLLVAVAVGGTLVALSAIVEPFYWHENPLTWRPGGTQGNPIFLGAYLIMVIPFTLAGLVSRMQGARSKRQDALWGAALLIQLAALALSGSRGPWVGALAGAIVLAGLMLWQRHRRAMIGGALAGLAGMGALLIGLNMAVVAAPSLASLPYVSRLNLAQDARTGTGRVRLVLWQMGWNVVTTWPQVIPDGDPLRSLRPLVGYGPDTASIVYTHAYPPELGRIEDPEAIWDRAHNETLDVLTMQGALGVLAYVALGIVCARRGLAQWRAATSTAQRAWIAAPMAALAAHVVEAQFAFTLTSAGMMAWLCIGLLHDAQSAGSKRQETQSTQIAIRSTSAVAVVVAVVLILVALRVEGGLVWADALAGRARALDRAGDWKQSIALYDRALGLVPWQAAYDEFRSEALYNLARALPQEQTVLRVQLLQAAEHGLARARKLLPLELELYSNSGVLHAYWADSADPAHLPLAEAFYRRAFALAPNRADLRDALGHIYHNRASYAEALAQYAAAIEIDPQFDAAHFDSGLAYLALGQREPARAAFQAALRLAPRCAECRDQLDALGP